MGLLSQGKPLDWDETKKYSKYVQERGVQQFINVYNRSKDRADGPFKWGDEVEYILVKFDHVNKVARVSLKAEEVFQKLEDLHKLNPKQVKSVWHPEFAAYMVEGTPAAPYGLDGNFITGLCDMETSMRFRRQEVQRVLGPGETVMSLTSFPRLGCLNFTHPVYQPRPETSASGSLFFPDEATFQGHPRFLTLVRNIRARRKRKVAINLPIYKDKRTKEPFVEHFKQHEARKAAKPDHVYMDAMGFGMGCCCLQITLQATHLKEARVLYDQMTPLTPILLALSAASPVYRGYLTDRDCRWEVISSSVDDRTKDESGEGRKLKDPATRVPKSRYDSLSAYLTKQGQMYNDIPLIINRTYYDLMVSNHVDPEVAQHIAHLFIRDPITLYREKLEQTDDDTDHFENIQSTNWQTMRFKPPPFAGSPIGWRVEFRPMDAQITDFENAAYSVFVILLSRVILAYKLNFLMPLSLVDNNMAQAQERNAVEDGKFWFRREVMPRSRCMKEPLGNVLVNSCNNLEESSQYMNSQRVPGSPYSNSPSPTYYNTRSRHQQQQQQQQQQEEHHCSELSNGPINMNNTSHNNIALSNNSDNINVSEIITNQAVNRVTDSSVEGYASKMTIDEIINGGEHFMGIMPIVRHYVDSLDDGSNGSQLHKIRKYLKLISDRAAVRTKTTARFIREFIDSHPAYRNDSVINDEINYDLLNLLDKIGREEVVCHEVTG